MPNTFQAIGFDLTDYHGPYGSVHIRDKTTVGLRLAAAAMGTVYGAGTYWQGPTVSSATIGSGQVTIHFDNTGQQGLELKPPRSKLNSTTWETCTPSTNGQTGVGINSTAPYAAVGGAADDPCALLAAGANGTGWHAATVSGSTASSVTVRSVDTMPLLAGRRRAGAAAVVLVRYGWSAVPSPAKATPAACALDAGPMRPGVTVICTCRTTPASRCVRSHLAQHLFDEPNACVLSGAGAVRLQEG
jgi:hypothetical protein